MKLAKAISLLGILAMSTALINAFATGDFGAEGQILIGMSWGIVSLVDLYVGFALFACWIYYREASPVRAIIWIVLLMVLGFLIGALYAFLALMNSNGDWQKFWLGSRQPTQPG